MDKNSEKHILIVGGGIAGMMLGWHLMRVGIAFKILDWGYKMSSSYRAAGLINPVTGRRFVLSWMYDQLIDYADRTYADIGDFLGHPIVKEVQFIRDFSNPLEENIWMGKCSDEQYRPHIAWTREVDLPETAFSGSKLFGVTRGRRVLTDELLERWRAFCLREGCWIEGRWSLPVTANMPLVYEDISFSSVVFATGAAPFWDLEWERLPLQPNGGEYLLVRIPDLDTDCCLKRKEVLVPIGEGLFWYGATYDWEGNRRDPSAEGLHYLKDSLERLLSLPYEIVEHRMGIRPTVRDRRPLMGRSRIHPEVYLFGGFGTKGFSLSPWWAHHFVDYLQGKGPLAPEVDIRRFQGSN